MQSSPSKEVNIALNGHDHRTLFKKRNEFVLFRIYTTVEQGEGKVRFGEGDLVIRGTNVIQ